MMLTNTAKRGRVQTYTPNRTIASRHYRPILIDCDLDQIIVELELKIEASEYIDLVDPEIIPTLAIYAAEYMLNRRAGVFILISTFCKSNRYHQIELVKIFRSVIDNHGYFVEHFHKYYDINLHYVYMFCKNNVATIVVTEIPDESAVAILSPEDEDDDYGDDY